MFQVSKQASARDCFAMPSNACERVENDHKNCKLKNLYIKLRFRPTILRGLLHTTYSQTLSHYCLTRKLLSAAFPLWAVTFLIIEPGQHEFLHAHHVDIKLSVDI